MTAITLFLIFLAILMMLVNFDKTILIVSAWILVLDMVKLPGGKLSLFGLIAVMAVALYFVRKKEHTTPRYPFWWCAIAVGISLAVTNIFSGESHWPTSIVNLISEFVFPFFLWKALVDSNSIHRFLKYYILFLSIFAIYGLYEAITGTNPIVDWMLTTDTFSSVGNSDRFRYGIKRIQSFLVLNGACGHCANCGCFLFVYLGMFHKQYVERHKTWIVFLVIALFVCMVCTGTRSVYLAFVAGALYFLRRSIFRYNYTYMLIILLLFLIPIFSAFLDEIVTSISDTESVGGSNADTREVQWQTAFYFMNKSLIYGNGAGFTFGYVAEHFRKDIYGAESVWLPLMMDRGVVGVLTYAIALLIPAVYCFRNKINIGLFLILSFIVLKTITSAPGIGSGYFLVLTTFVIRLNQIEREKEAISNDINPAQQQVEESI